VVLRSSKLKAGRCWRSLCRKVRRSWVELSVWESLPWNLLAVVSEPFATGLVESKDGIWATDLDPKGGLAPVFQGDIAYLLRGHLRLGVSNLKGLQLEFAVDLSRPRETAQIL
jgi:hypothetical protein